MHGTVKLSAWEEPKDEAVVVVRKNSIGDEELVATAPNQRNWRGIILALLVITFIISMIVVSVVVLTPDDTRTPITGSRFTLEDIVSGDFKVNPFNGSWLSDHELVYRDMWGGLSVLNCESMAVRLLVSNVTFRQHKVRHYWVSSDQQYVLLAHDVRQKFRHSYLAKYTIYDVARGFSAPLTPTPEERGHPALSYAAWVPTDNVTHGRGNALVMVYKNDIYYKTSAAAETVDRVTTSGQPGVVFNGVPDWLYEEEILSTNVAMWFSRRGDRMVYATFNDSGVTATPVTYYQPSGGDTKYPAVYWIRYPQAGTANPEVTLWVVNLRDIGVASANDLRPPTGLKSDYYFTDVSWVDEKTVSVVWANRHQNTSHISECVDGLWYCSESHVQEQAAPGWLEVQAAPLYAADGRSYLTLQPVRDADEGRFQHISHVDVLRKQLTPVTIGAFEVLELLGWDEPKQVIYFTAVPQGTPGERHLYRVNRTTTALYRPTPECLTCPDNSTERPCLFGKTLMGPRMRYYVLECLGPDLPFTELYMLPENKLLTLLDNNTAIREKAAEMAWPQVRHLTVPLSEEQEAAVELILPPGLRDDEVTRYPMIVEVYGGPGTQQVTSRWRVGWHTYMASGRNFIYARIDGRGSGNRGQKLKHSVHGKLGTIEVQDQLKVVRKLTTEQYFIDSRRVVIWGWSYGGFAAAMALALDNRRLFRGAVSVAPVTDWNLYDSAYTERYMGPPGARGNYRGYEEADLTSRAESFRNKNLLLIHGSADDNVHVQHSMLLSRALVKAGVTFRQQIYPDENHFLSGVKRHMFTLMEDFIERCFLPPKRIIDEALEKLRKKKKID
ncbi:dipeptidyl peptidase 4-like isoform X1 [Amphibalanus amphitrite]|uniref:dipeptidyl peptidase 4-like isoform X1 n=1 Tax=Amphibalanus amphitrite TaxID=1232801 RepID=UPI001C9253B4|nr:dipeptidyl peptidase 4-like isoform X1 [Amphibalanus amphitrite]